MFNQQNKDAGVFVSSPGNALKKRHLYSLIKKDGTRDPDLEVKIGLFEGKIAPILREKIIDVIRGGNDVSLSSEERHLLNVFVYLQWKRPPELHMNLFNEEEYDQVINESIIEYKETFGPLSDEEIQEVLSPAGRSRIINNARIDALGMHSPYVIEIMNKVGMHFAHIKNPNRSFIVGSNPVVKLTGKTVTLPGQPGVEIWFPIAHDIALLMAGKSRTISTVPMTRDQDIRYINLAIAQNSNMFAGRSERLVKSLCNPR